MGAALGLKAFAVAIIGGLSSGMGVVVGGLILGITENLTGFYISTGYKDVPGLVLLLLVLSFKPSGLFGKRRDQEGLSGVRQSIRSPSGSSSLRCSCSRSSSPARITCICVVVIAIYAIVTLGLDIVFGYTGEVSLGHAALFGIGAYTAGVLAFQLGIGLPAGAAARRRDRGGVRRRPGAAGAARHRPLSRDGDARLRHHRADPDQRDDLPHQRPARHLAAPAGVLRLPRLRATRLPFLDMSLARMRDVRVLLRRRRRACC